ncbi:toprim domain-containing protein [Marihabitans asiaticum]|uniref:toprim domain-containing protein n=1 Tax=Marihabitans asiaticum TaxID=415218 RepID=UPI00119EAD9B|nr:toprim domain-containing protein [Marihabitans asiaticum]
MFGKNFVSDQLMLVFTEGDLFVDTTKRDELSRLEELSADHPEVDAPLAWHSRLMGYSATAAALRTRLELQGFSSARVRSLCTAYFDDEFSPNAEDGHIDPRDSWPEGRSAYPDGAAVTAVLSSRRGQAAAQAPIFQLDDPEQRFLNNQWVSLREGFDDPRFALALSLMNTRPDTPVTLDLTDLILGGWMEFDDLPHVGARARMAAAVSASGPVIVITEGPSDARWLRRALEITAPAAAHLFEFLDFAEYQAPGGTDRVVSLTKGMASAKVMNRIVAVLDNDTAGRVAAQQLQALRLPSHIAVTTLPEVKYATSYPTLGPSGSTVTNVNGRAASIEFMFGEDVLRDTDGSMFPVRWQSFIGAADDYQGRLDKHHKAIVKERIDHAFMKAGSAGMPHEVLGGCHRLADMLLAAADPPPHIPASEFSDLPASWRRSQV